VIEDISDRKQAEEEGRESEYRYRRVFESVQAGLTIRTRDGDLVDANPAMCNLIGYSLEEFRKLDLEDYIHPDSLPELEDLRNRLMAGESPQMEVTALAKNGRPRILDVRVNPFDLRGELHALISVNDITDRKKFEQELQIALAENQELMSRLEAENLNLRGQIRTAHLSGEILGGSDALHAALARAEKVAETESTTLILGETGTGKELLARAIHRMSPRRNKPMITVNCAAIPAALIENELFGSEKGAYTGAVSRQIGRFEAADGGSLFLDEIGELPLELQVKLLRVLQEGQFERLGSTRTLTVDVRVIAATNSDLETMVEQGRFRRDLFYRLNVFPITVPPLRSRVEDIPVLTRAFVAEFAAVMGKPVASIRQSSLAALSAYPWPGNVRELRNVIERAMIEMTGPVLTVRLPEDPLVPRTAVSNRLEDVEREHIKRVLAATGWRVRGKRGAAEALDLHPSTLESRMKKLGIKRPPPGSG
jgi:PAS domain S-box-containing protein